MFQALLYCSYIVKHYPSYPSITMWSSCVAQARYLYYPSTRICFGISANPNFYLPTWLIPGNISWMTFLGCRYHHTGTCRNWQCSENDLQHDVIQRVGHGHPQYRLMLLPTTPLLHASKFSTWFIHSYCHPCKFYHVYQWYPSYINSLLQVGKIPTLD